MTLVTLFAPIAVGSPFTYRSLDSSVMSVDILVIAPVWSFGTGENFYTAGLFVFEPLHIIGYLSVTFFGIVFGVLVVRHCQDKCSRKWVRVAALASIAVPLFILALKVPTYLALHYLAYDGPVPIQLIVGLLVVRSHRVPGSESPWFNEERAASRYSSSQ